MKASALWRVIFRFKEEVTFFEKKVTKSLFASFSSEKEGLPCFLEFPKHPYKKISTPLRDDLPINSVMISLGWRR
jgi:hypothetical protein